MFKMKQHLFTVFVITAVVILILLVILFLITKSFIFKAILHSYLRLLEVPIFIKVLKRCFKEQLTHSMDKVLIICGCTIVLDIVVVDAFRYILSKGVSTVLFLPIFIPICLMIAMFYSIKDTARDKMAEKRLTYILGIPLFLLSLYSEIASFMRI